MAMPSWLYRAVISLSRIQGHIILGFTGIKLHHLQPYIPEPNRTESSISAVNSVRLVYYSNRTLSSASIGTSIRFGSRSKIPSGEAIRLENTRYGSVRFEDVRYGEPSLPPSKVLLCSPR